MERAIVPDAQTEQRDEAGPVRRVLGGMALSAIAFFLHHRPTTQRMSREGRSPVFLLICSSCASQGSLRRSSNIGPKEEASANNVPNQYTASQHFFIALPLSGTVNKGGLFPDLFGWHRLAQRM